LYREGVGRILADEGSLRVVGTGPPDEASIHQIAAEQPHIILIDSASTCTPDIVRGLSSAWPAGRIVAIGNIENEEQVLNCAEAGVAGYLGSDASVSEVAHDVRDIACGQFCCPPSIAAMLFHHVAISASRGGGKAAAVSHLTTRERGIVTLIDRGLASKEIAATLSIAVATVKNHVHHILEKMGVARRAAATAKLRLAAHEPQDLDLDDEPISS